MRLNDGDEVVSLALVDKVETEDEDEVEEVIEPKQNNRLTIVIVTIIMTVSYLDNMLISRYYRYKIFWGLL